MTGLWTEVCITWPTIEMLGAGYNIYVGRRLLRRDFARSAGAALSRMVQAGAVRVTTIAALLEWQRDWKNREHYNALMGILKQQGGAYGVGVGIRLHDGSSRTAVRAEAAGRAEEGWPLRLSLKSGAQGGRSSPALLPHARTCNHLHFCDVCASARASDRPHSRPCATTKTGTYPARRF
jgi:hypothetical protein